MKLTNEIAVIVPSTNGPSVADPVLIQTQIDKALDDPTGRYIFALDYTSQFEIGFSVYRKDV